MVCWTVRNSAKLSIASGVFTALDPIAHIGKSHVEGMAAGNVARHEPRREIRTMQEPHRWPELVGACQASEVKA